MKIFPAIDLLNGKVVRLTQGDYSQSEIFSDEPLAIKQCFANAAAKCLHVVDLDGARSGERVNFEVIRSLTDDDTFIEVGGGIRTEQSIASYLELGVSRVILGTVAVENPAFVGEMVKRYGDKISVGVDARDGMVAVHGWKTSSPYPSFDFCRQMQDLGVSTVIYTDIATDGAMSGTNMAAFEELTSTTNLRIIASGGISSLKELRLLRGLGVEGAILGKALYKGLIDLRTAIALARGANV